MQAEQSAGTPNQLTAAQRRRGLITLLTDVICMNTGFFMVIPLISVHYVDGLGWAATSIGLALALRQLVQQGFTLIGGMVADQIGVKQLICMGLVIRIIGFGLMAWASSLPILLLSTILAGLGGAMFEAPRLAAVAALTLPEERQRYYSLSGALAGIGMALGPFLGSLLLHIDFATVALVGAGCFTLNLIQMLIMLPQVRVATNPGSLGHGLKLVWHDRVFVFYTLLMMGYWFMWVQISISVPLLVMRITDSSDTIGIVYTINAFTAVVLQYPLIRLMARFMRPMLALILGVGLMTLAMGSAIIANSYPALLVSVVMFSLASALVQPLQQTVSASLANPAALGSFFGFASLALAIGGGIGNFSGGLLDDLGKQIGVPALPWIIFFTIGSISTIGLILLDRMHERRVATQSVIAQSASPH
jgi:DHA1 family multidrug resistance protein-like MFS transporter